MDTRDLTLAAIFTSLYFVINTLQTMVGGPITYGPVQFRVVDCLLALAALFGWPVVSGVTVGAFLANAYYFLDPLDVTFGPIANLIAASLILLLRNRRLLACVVGALPIGIIVGGYLWLFFPPPETLGFLPVWAAMIASITISSLIAIGIVGYILLVALSRPSVIEPLKSRGLKVIE
jgi:uncharacterized membrane protein